MTNTETVSPEVRAVLSHWLDEQQAGAPQPLAVPYSSRTSGEQAMIRSASRMIAHLCRDEHDPDSGELLVTGTRQARSLLNEVRGSADAAFYALAIRYLLHGDSQ